MLLLNIINEWACKNSKIVNVLSFDHNLRSDSSKEIHLVKKECEKIGVIL